MTVREAYERALESTKNQGVPDSQQKMVACLAVKDAMEDTRENLIALRTIMNEIRNEERAK